jgi:hypothetical protein
MAVLRNSSKVVRRATLEDERHKRSIVDPVGPCLWIDGGLAFEVRMTDTLENKLRFSCDQIRTHMFHSIPKSLSLTGLLETTLTFKIPLSLTIERADVDIDRVTCCHERRCPSRHDSRLSIPREMSV